MIYLPEFLKSLVYNSFHFIATKAIPFLFNPINILLQNIMNHPEYFEIRNLILAVVDWFKTHILELFESLNPIEALECAALDIVEDAKETAIATEHLAEGALNAVLGYMGW